MTWLSLLIPNLFIVITTILGILVGAGILYSAKFFPRENQSKIAVIGLLIIVSSFLYFIIGSVIKNLVTSLFQSKEAMIIVGAVIVVVGFGLFLFYPRKNKKIRKTR